MRRVAVITKASRRIVRATALVLGGRRPGSRQDQGEDQTAWWLVRQVVCGATGAAQGRDTRKESLPDT